MIKSILPWVRQAAILPGLLFAGTLANAAPVSTVVVYPAPAGVELNDTFSVAVRAPGGEWRPLDIYDVRVDVYSLSHASFAYFDFSGQVEVQVTQNKVHVKQVEIRPAASHVEARMSSQTADSFTFTLDRPRNLSIEVNGDRLHNLHLFANPMETNVPSLTDTNVIYFGPGLTTNRQTISVGSGQTVYLAGGSVVQGVIVTAKGATNVTIRGRGILDTAKWNDAKGYYVKGKDWQTASIKLRWTTNALVEGIILKQHIDYAIMGGAVDNVTIDNLKSFSSQEWGDGIDMVSSRHVKIRNCFLRTSDDCIAVYGSRGDYHGGSSDWDVADSVFWADKAHAVMIGVHGAYWADGDVIENLRFHNIDVLEEVEYSTNFWGALAITCGDKNTVRNVDFDNIRVEHIREAGGYLIRLVFGHFEPSITLGRQIENVRFKDITYNGQAGSFVGGGDGRPINGVKFENLIINGEKIKDAGQGKITIGKNVGGVTFN
ncbi:MAG TPA: glycosyl hydrolase family 28 protein [Candidatus Acidoferrales bacterium]|nr:glycosyl hydrolase family 28 protein [Candidatus Acidoferrales bacterium]